MPHLSPLSARASLHRPSPGRFSHLFIARTTIALFAAASILSPAPRLPAADNDQHSGLIVNAPTPKPINYDALTQEATALLQQEIRIDTTNPPGNELPVAKLLKAKL